MIICTFFLLDNSTKNDAKTLPRPGKEGKSKKKGTEYVSVMKHLFQRFLKSENYI